MRHAAMATSRKLRHYPHPNLPLKGQGNRIWRQRAFSPLPSGRGGDPSPRRWEGEGELPPPVFVRRQHESGSSPPPPRPCGAGPPLSPLGRGRRSTGPPYAISPPPRGGGPTIFEPLSY